jgi:phage virion morphogenesis protein
MFTIDVDDSGAEEALAELLRRGEDLTPLMANIAEDFHRVAMDNFEQQGQPAWEPLSPATIRSRAKRGHWPGKILQQSGQMMASVAPFSDDTSAGLGVATPYAAIQQLGGDIERGAYSSTARLRTDARGDLVRQLDDKGKKTNRAVFAKDSHKRVRSVRYTTEGFSIHIPARPYLPVTVSGELQPEAETALTARLGRYLTDF